MTTTTQDVCGPCNGNLWVEDESWQPEDHERHRPRLPGAGLIPCGACNAGNWDGPQPYPGWPGPCHEYACEAVHPCALFHDPTACERRTPLDGCGCDLGLDEPDDPPNARPRDEHPWCEHQHCHDRVHLDGLHTDERGRFFRDTPDPVYEPQELIYDDDPDTAQAYDDDQDVQWPADVIAEPPRPQPFPLTPIYDQLVAELIPAKVHP